MQTIIGLKELRNNTEKYIGAVKRGRSFTVVRRSAPVFHITPVPVDEWGDEGVWETVLDLTKGEDRKITADQLLAYLREFDAKQSRKVSQKARWDTAYGSFFVLKWRGGQKPTKNDRCRTRTGSSEVLGRTPDFQEVA